MNSCSQKVKMNLEFYYGADQYSDGDIEDVVLDIVKNNENYNEILQSCTDWSVFYHLSPKRHFLLDWYNFSNNSTVLEIGSGCGAMTGILAQKCQDVTCVELSLKRSLINAYRNQKHSNIEIMVGNFNDIEINKQYDYITLIGVLEYGNLYTKSEQGGYLAFLKKTKQYLKKSGTLIIAIENKFGLKYFCGSKEDHTGKVFSGIEGYPDSQVVTFAKNELVDLLNELGFTKLQFYYPFPDYKFPEQIFSDNYLPKSGDVKVLSQNYDQSRYVLFDEKLALNSVIKSKAFDFFSNSFLIFAS